jgi:AcrR family transcriptional regulator
MPRPRADAHAVPTPERLLQAALPSFADAGFQAARLEDIAARAGVRRASLLYHFEDKDTLYAGVVRRAFAELREVLAGAMESEDPDPVAGVVLAYRGFLDSRPEVARLILREVLDGRGPGREILVAEAAPLTQAVAEFLGEGRALGGAVMMVATNILVRAASGALRDPLWGDDDRDVEWARCLLGEGGAA